MTTKEEIKKKEAFIKLAKKKGFESKVLYNKPYLYSSNEPMRWLFWLTEIQNWLRINHDIHMSFTKQSKTWYYCTIYNKDQHGWNPTNAMNKPYDEVFENGIEWCLKLLPDVED